MKYFKISTKKDYDEDNFIMKKLDKKIDDTKYEKLEKIIYKKDKNKFDIFGDSISPKEIEIYIFADERKKINNQWDYIAILIIPSDKISKALEILKEHRQKIGYNKEIKFSSVNKKAKGEKFELAKNWLLEIIKDGQENRGIFYFNILGIDRNNLDFRFFGNDNTPKGKYANIYNRFFRTVFLSGVKSFFHDYDNIIVKNIFHDTEGNLESHKYFNWHLIWKVTKNEEKINFNNDEIIFLNSDPDKEQNYKEFSDFIQLIDIIVGSISYCLDYSNPNNMGQEKLGKIILPLVERLIYKSSNKNSKYGYFNKYKLSFFPKVKLNFNNNLQSEIYTVREIALKNKNQLSLF